MSDPLIERKFLVTNEGWKSKVDPSSEGGADLIQGYLQIKEHENAIIRVRIKDGKGYFAIEKGFASDGNKIAFQYEIPTDDAEDMLGKLVSNSTLHKTRYTYTDDKNHTWEVDVYDGKHEGLVVAAVKYPTGEGISKPHWAGIDITDNKAFKMSSLALSGKTPSVGPIK